MVKLVIFILTLVSTALLSSFVGYCKGVNEVINYLLEKGIAEIDN